MENLNCDSALPSNTNTNARTDNKLRCKEIDLKMKAERFAPLQSSHHIINWLFYVNSTLNKIKLPKWRLKENSVNMQKKNYSSSNRRNRKVEEKSLSFLQET